MTTIRDMEQTFRNNMYTSQDAYERTTYDHARRAASEAVSASDFETRMNEIFGRHPSYQRFVTAAINMAHLAVNEDYQLSIEDKLRLLSREYQHLYNQSYGIEENAYYHVYGSLSHTVSVEQAMMNLQERESQVQRELRRGDTNNEYAMTAFRIINEARVKVMQLDMSATPRASEFAKYPDVASYEKRDVRTRTAATHYLDEIIESERLASRRSILQTLQDIMRDTEYVHFQKELNVLVRDLGTRFVNTKSDAMTVMNRDMFPTKEVLMDEYQMITAMRPMFTRVADTERSDNIARFVSIRKWGVLVPCASKEEQTHLRTQLLSDIRHGRQAQYIVTYNQTAGVWTVYDLVTMNDVFNAEEDSDDAPKARKFALLRNN